MYFTDMAVPVKDIVQFLERFILGYGIYQILIFLILNMINDIKKDSYLAIRTNYEQVVLALECNDQNLINKIRDNLNYQLDNSTLNSIKIRKEYGILLSVLSDKNINEAKYKVSLFNHLFEYESLQWRYSVLLRIFK